MKSVNLFKIKFSSVAVPCVGFKLIASVLYSQCTFEIGPIIAFFQVYLLNSSLNCIMPFPPKKCTSYGIRLTRLLVCPISYTLIRAGVAVQGPLVDYIVAS